MAVINEKRAAFAALHARDGAFFLPNPWDIGSARLLAARGAEALATTSAGFAFTRGRADGEDMDRDAAIAHAVEIDSATRLPVSADLENGFSDEPEGVADCVRAAIDAGLAGCSIEDVAPPSGARGRAYAFDHALARIQAAIAASREARAEGFRLTARADGVMIGEYDVEEALRRLKAFEAAGADVLYAPALPDPDALHRICQSLKAPVNALAAGPFLELSRRDFASIGAQRVSLGSSLARHVQGALDRAATALFNDGDPSPMIGGADHDSITALLREGAAPAEEGENES